MAVYLIPVFIVSLVLIALVIFYVISERAAFKELQSGFPEEFAANGMNAVSVQSQALPVRETVENLPEDDPGEPYVPDISDDEDLFPEEDDSDGIEEDIPEDLPWDE